MCTGLMSRNSDMTSWRRGCGSATLRPRLRRMLTEKPSDSGLTGLVDICARSATLRHAQTEQSGNTVSAVVVRLLRTQVAYCTLFIDHPATELRVWHWQTWQRKIVARSSGRRTTGPPTPVSRSSTESIRGSDGLRQR